MDRAAKQDLLARLSQWRDQDEPLAEEIGNTLAGSERLDSQEQARRVVDDLIAVLDREF